MNDAIQFDPERFVKIKSKGKGGHPYLVLAKVDFDPAVHELLGKAPKGKDAEGSSAGDDKPAATSIVDLNVANAQAFIAEVSDLAQLGAIEAQERDHPKAEGGRKGVLDAIADRRAELKG